jgi:hypothetical protein
MSEQLDADDLVVEFVDGRQGMVGIATGPWHDEPDERMALDLLGGLRLKQARASLAIFDVGHSDCRWYTTFEAVRGIDLPDLRRLLPDRLEAVASTYIVYHLARFLRDVGHDWSHITRPEHVLLADSGDLRVAFFEAYARGSCDSLIDRNRPATDWHDMLAPELFRTDVRTEGMMVYALGVLFTYLITGRRPLKRSSARTTVMEAFERTSPISELIPLPPALAPVVDAATHPDAACRLSTLEALEENLAPHVAEKVDVRAVLAPLIEAKSQLADERVRFCI